MNVNGKNVDKYKFVKKLDQSHSERGADGYFIDKPGLKGGTKTKLVIIHIQAIFDFILKIWICVLIIIEFFFTFSTEILKNISRNLGLIVLIVFKSSLY